MTNERAIYRLAKDCLDEVALVEIYRNNRKEIDHTISMWFGMGTAVHDVLSRVLAKVAKSALSFHPEIQTAQDFITDCTNEECSRLFYEATHRVALAHHN